MGGRNTRCIPRDFGFSSSSNTGPPRPDHSAEKCGRCDSPENGGIQYMAVAWSDGQRKNRDIPAVDFIAAAASATDARPCPGDQPDAAIGSHLPRTLSGGTADQPP